MLYKAQLWHGKDWAAELCKFPTEALERCDHKLPSTEMQRAPAAWAIDLIHKYMVIIN